MPKSKKPTPQSSVTAPPAKGIDTHPLFKLGKDQAKRDSRNLKLAAILLTAALPPTPPSWDYDLAHPGIPTPMFMNDTYGDCVIAGRAHQTLRFENMEQGSLITITDRVVKNEYFRESDGEDSGLVVLDSLNLWRRKGWKIGKHNYRIQAFAEINRTNHQEARDAIFTHVGIGIGLGLPISAQRQSQMGLPWDIDSASSPEEQEPWSWGGHYVHVCGFTPSGLICVTWGRKQQLTWAFWDKYCDEAYAIIDRQNRFRKAINEILLEEFLSTVTPPTKD